MIDVYVHQANLVLTYIINQSFYPTSHGKLKELTLQI